MRIAEGLDFERLLAQGRAGNSSAIGCLLESYRAYLRLLLRLQSSRRASPADASDVVQEVFLRAGQHFVGFRGSTERELTAWLRHILATTLVDEERRRRIGQHGQVGLAEIAATLDQSSHALDCNLLNPGSSPSQQASRREQAVLLADALARLPEHYREVIVLRHLQNLSFPEIARRTERSLDSVKNIWVRALTELRGHSQELL